VEVHVARDRSNFGSESCDLVGEHARSWDLNCVVPVVVVVTKRVSKVQDSHLGDFRGVLGHIEMSRLDRALSDGVRNQEEIEASVDNLRLLNEALVDVGALRRVVNKGFTRVLLVLLEESLADTLVHNDQRDFWSLKYLLLITSDFLREKAVFFRDDLVKLR